MTLEFEPGPFFVRDTPPAPDWPGTPGRFSQQIGSVATTAAFVDNQLGAAARDIASTDDGGLRQMYTLTIGEAAYRTDQEQQHADDQTAGVLLTTGAGADSVRLSVARYLPPANTPITVDFVEPIGPPPPPGGPGPGAGDGADTQQPQ